MRFLCFFLIFFLQLVTVFSQDENSTYFKIEGDSVFKKEIDLKEVVIYKPVVFADNQERLNYFVLKRKVLKVYPYAKMASERLAKLNDRLNKIKSKRKKKKYTKMLEKFLQEELTMFLPMEEIEKTMKSQNQKFV